jgi:hypothetical protein
LKQESNKMSDKRSSIDLVWGAKSIADEIGVGHRKAFYLLERGAIPARKVRSRWVAERSKLREFFASDDRQTRQLAPGDPMAA